MSSNPWIAGLPADRLATIVDNEIGGVLMKRHHTDDVYFAIWLHALDRVVQNTVLVSYDDLEDWDYWSNYDAGASPKEAAVQMLEDNGWDEAMA